MEDKRKYVTKKKMTHGPKTYRGWKEWAVGDIFVGKYLESYIDDKYNQKKYVFETVETFFKDKKVKLTEGSCLVLNSCGMLKKMEDKLEVGNMYQIEYTGISEIAKGKFAGKESHTISVEEVALAGDSEEEFEL
jgi:hypothetical protein